MFVLEVIPTKYPRNKIELDAQQKELLQSLINDPNTAKRTALHAKILLESDVSNPERLTKLELAEKLKKASGFDVIKAVVDLTLGNKPHVGELKSESKYITNTFLYCNPGVLDHLEGFDEALKKGLITEYCQLASKGTVFDSVTCSGDRAACFTIQADDIETIKRKNESVNKIIKVVDINGKDILMHELMNNLGD